jgi:hypothetical protein
MGTVGVVNTQEDIMGRSRTLTRLAGIALACTVFVLAGCSNNDPVVPGIEPEVVNSTDNFQFQVTAMQNYTGTLEYVWANTGPMADVDQSCQISAGSAALVLLDNGGAQVYSNDLSQGGSYVSSSGTAGDWRIRVVLSGASGTLNFRADMRPAP